MTRLGLSIWCVAPFVLVPVSAFAQTPDSTAPSDSEVQAAIEFGRGAKHTTDIGYRYTVKQVAFGGRGMWGETIDVTARGPLARIAAAASDAAHRYLAFTPESVTTELRSMVVEIGAQPQPPFGVAAEPVRSVRHVVLQTPDRGMTVQPTAVDTLVQNWTASGTTQRLQGLKVTFPAGALPAGEFDIVLIMNDERQLRHRVDVKGRARLFGTPQPPPMPTPDVGRPPF